MMANNVLGAVWAIAVSLSAGSPIKRRDESFVQLKPSSEDAHKPGALPVPSVNCP
jgi:hypothetical protein